MNEQVTAAAIRLHPADNVVVAARAMPAGAAVTGESILCARAIPAGHKVATAPIAAGEAVRKYNQIIGFANTDIPAGEHVHVHNCVMGDFERDYAFGSEMRPTAFVPVSQRATFEGYVRPGGQVGTRNYIGIMTTVNCSATVAKMIAAAFAGDALKDYPNVDGVAAFVHGTGCGMATKGDGFDILQRTLWGYLKHPNFAGVLLVGLGCEAAQIRFLIDIHGDKPGPIFRHMTIQGTGGTRATVEEGVRVVKEMLAEANTARRQTVSAEHLSLCLQCGGSDGYSGISANPALGAAVDLLVAHGGTAILSETPEIYGAEHLLTRRAVKREVGETLVERIRWWEHYTAINEGEMNNNPSPGNKAGGLTTILEKSLGAVAKGGTSNLEAVYEYAEPVRAHGFVYMDTPGYDPVSATGQVAGGANMICFTTGRGSAYGCAPSPSLKLATNSALWQRQEEDMDINCGEIVEGSASIQEMGQRIFELVLKTASGEPSKSEKHGYGQNEFVPWQVGAVM